MSVVTEPTTPSSHPSHYPSLSSTPNPHRRLYNHQVNNISISDQPLMLLPKAKVHNDNDDLLRRRMFTVVPDNGLEHLQISAISGSSGWIGEDGRWGGLGGGGGGGGMVGGYGKRPLTAYDYNARTKRKEIKESRSGISESEAESEATRPATSHPLLTRRGKMALLRHRTKRHISSSDRSASVESGLDTPSLADKNSHDVIASDVFDEVSRYNSSEFVAPEHGRHRSSSNSRGVFAAYINNKFQTHDESGNNSSRIVLSSARDSISNQDDVDTLLTSEPHIHDVRTFPDHLDSFADVADAIIGHLRKKKKSDNDESDDVFDDRWHSGHEDGDDCPFCEEFSRATKRRMDRVFGGTESFLGWIFSKWGKVSTETGSSPSGAR
ncbi:uncharacterized protein [Littorina saxatilis]|uniref:Uncharacterized protein n=1 Tax=Littorina saxatilis TaxID=31220 RepID=A0AAN9FVA6_9CAEN